MKCASKDVLRGYADGVLDAGAFSKLKGHLESCGRCRLELEQLSHHSAGVFQLLGRLEPALSAGRPDVEKAYERFQCALPRKRTSWNFVWRRRVWASVAATCALLAVVVFAPARGWAQHVLEMLRVQHVAVVPVDLGEMGNNEAHARLAAQFLSDNVVVTMKPGNPLAAGSLSDASAAAGFTVKPLPGTEPSMIVVSEPGAFHMTLNRDRITALLEGVGRGDVAVPNSVDGSTVAIYVPKSVRLSYANVTFSQMPSPTVSVPKTLDMTSLAEVALEVAGMSTDEAQAFCKGVDWTSTLVIPIPQGKSSYRTVEVDGVNGSLVEMQGHRNRSSATLIWVKNKVVNTLQGSDESQVLSAAASLN